MCIHAVGRRVSTLSININLVYLLKLKAVKLDFAACQFG